MRSASLLTCLLLCPVALACSSDSDPADGDSGPGGSGGGAGTGGGTGGLVAACTMPTEVPCSDEVIQQMNLKPDPVAAPITNTPAAMGFTTNIDATAGGAFNPDPTSFTYGRFGEAGLEKVDIGDEASLESMDWDIGFRRYVARVNSGHSGPSCVTAARVPPGTAYDALTSVPADLNYRVDEYFTDSCELIPDGSGLENSPATALSSYWTYPGCVKMTGNVFVIQLASGRHVKFIVDSFYSPEVQQECQDTDAVPMGDTGSGNFVVRWAWLD